ncbi:MAG: DUF4856 domain-containing protein [Bacteroidia bacterium]
MNLKKRILPVLILFAIGLTACDKTPEIMIDNPATYAFSRNGQSTVSFSGQTTRIQMATELINAMKDFDGADKVLLLEMYRNETATGEDANPYANADLNTSTKSVKSKVAASKDFFSANTVDAAAIKAEIESWIEAQIDEVFPAENELAEAGKAGQIADGSSTRYINAKGLEYNQAVNKSLIGALMLDQILNHYLSPAVLDEADNRTLNDAATPADGQSYTTMEHKWDEAYGYVYGTASDLADPNAGLGDADAFLSKYIGRVEGDTDFAGIADDIFQAFKLGRAAIVAGDYALRDEQADIIKDKLSQIIAIRAVYYLQQGKLSLEKATPAYGTAFHDISEGYGFIYSLMFSRIPGTNNPYFTKTEVEAILNDLMEATNGLWEVTPATLDALSNTIADKFDFTLAQAAE